VGDETVSDGRTDRRTALGALRQKHAHRGAMADVAYWTLREAMRAGVIRPGEQLVELDLAAALAMSRTPIREALRRLEVERLVENAPRRGLVVPTITLDDLIEIFEIREVLEGLAARRAAQRMGAAELAAVGGTIARMEQALASGDLIQLGEASTQFHRLIRTGSRYSRLPTLLSLMFDAHRSVSVHEFAPDRAAAAVAEHRAIYEAIAAHDQDAAERLAREHSRNALRAQILAHELVE